MILSVVIPCYNEKHIKRQVDIVKQYLDINIDGADYEIIVVNDGSKFFDYEPDNDKTRVVSYDVNHGKGYAVKKGFEAAEGESVIFMDCDLATSLKAVNDSLAIKKDYDIVIGNRYHKDSNVKRSFIRLMLSKCMNILERIVLGINVADTQCGFKVFSKAVAKDFAARQKIDGFAFDLEYLYLAKRLGYSVKDIGVEWHENGEESKVNLKKSWRAVTDVFAIRRFYK